MSRAEAVEVLALPDVVNVPLSQHIGAPAVAKVAKGDKVKVGELIAEAAGFVSANIHAPVSGTVTGVDMLPNGQITTIHQGSDAGRLKASRTPVTTADRSLTVQGPLSRNF